MSVDRDEVRRIAELAKLRLDDDEANRLTDEMNRILEHAQRLRGLGPSPSGEMSPGQTSSRPRSSDEPSSGDASEERSPPGGAGPDRRSDGPASPAAGAPDALLRPLPDFAPDVREGFFVVPPPPGVVHDDAP